ncbi:MAG TPA: ABC transporter ATP-binding protein [Polyangiaceae bacterium]|nr:ABC transporter ATP-binding protein [Polyangiaceae bacterium]
MKSVFMSELIQVQDLEKEFRLGLTRKRVQAVRGISFAVPEREIFGFLGPNGAGKTTTIKILTGLIRPTRGQASLFGKPAGDPQARSRIGFLPENPYVYPYLTPFEFVTLCGRLSGLRGHSLRDRARQVLERTGVWYAADRPVRRLSKGMLQRTGLAAALVADPELLVLDEPMSGLDPVGRKEVKDLIVDERAQGRTVFFSTHILGDVESMCDRVTILRQGRIVVFGQLDALLRREVQRTSLVVRGANSELAQRLRSLGAAEDGSGRLRVEIEGRETLNELIRLAASGGAEIEEVTPRHETLEDLFVREAIAPREGATAEREPTVVSS